jgi:hypothetical protein
VWKVINWEPINNRLETLDSQPAHLIDELRAFREGVGSNPREIDGLAVFPTRFYSELESWIVYGSGWFASYVVVSSTDANDEFEGVVSIMDFDLQSAL